MAMPVQVVEGDLLDQKVDVIVNAWNRNTIPFWLLIPQGVSGAIKRKGGIAPFVELAKTGRMGLGEARLTGPGRLPFKGIIHVAAINDFWRSSELAIRRSVAGALRIAEEQGFRSVALPNLGSGSGGFPRDRAQEIILDEIRRIEPSLDVVVVRFR